MDIFACVRNNHLARRILLSVVPACTLLFQTQALHGYLIILKPGKDFIPVFKNLQATIFSQLQQFLSKKQCTDTLSIDEENKLKKLILTIQNLMDYASKNTKLIDDMGVIDNTSTAAVTYITKNNSSPTAIISYLDVQQLLKNHRNVLTNFDPFFSNKSNLDGIPLYLLNSSNELFEYFIKIKSLKNVIAELSEKCENNLQNDLIKTTNHDFIDINTCTYSEKDRESVNKKNEISNTEEKLSKEIKNDTSNTLIKSNYDSFFDSYSDSESDNRLNSFCDKNKNNHIKTESSSKKSQNDIPNKFFRSKNEISSDGSSSSESDNELYNSCDKNNGIKELIEIKAVLADCFERCKKVLDDYANNHPFIISIMRSEKDPMSPHITVYEKKDIDTQRSTTKSKNKKERTSSLNQPKSTKDILQCITQSQRRLNNSLDEQNTWYKEIIGESENLEPSEKNKEIIKTEKTIEQNKSKPDSLTTLEQEGEKINKNREQYAQLTTTLLKEHEENEKHFTIIKSSKEINKEFFETINIIENKEKEIKKRILVMKYNQNVLTSIAEKNHALQTLAWLNEPYCKKKKAICPKTFFIKNFDDNIDLFKSHKIDQDTLYIVLKLDDDQKPFKKFQTILGEIIGKGSRMDENRTFHITIAKLTKPTNRLIGIQDDEYEAIKIELKKIVSGMIKEKKVEPKEFSIESMQALHSLSNEPLGTIPLDKK